MTVKLCGKNQLIVIPNWVQGVVQRRIIPKLKTGIVAAPKTIVITELLSKPPSWFTRLVGRMTGNQYRLHRRAMHIIQDHNGFPRMVRRWCRRQKLTGTLYTDGFFVSRRGLWVYLDHLNEFKDTIWKK